MIGTFHIDPLDPTGEPDASAGTWYVKEGDYVHCTCYSTDDVKLALKYIKKLDDAKVALKKTRFDEYVFELDKWNCKVASKLALEALTELDLALKYERLFPAAEKPAVGSGQTKSEHENKHGKNSPP